MEGDIITSPAPRGRKIFQSTPSAWRETCQCTLYAFGFRISIHSLRMEGDIWGRCPGNAGRSNFNPLPPHGGRRSLDGNVRISEHFNPLPPHGGRPPRALWLSASAAHFNPLPPHGGRPCWNIMPGLSLAFQSTPSAWRETRPSEIQMYNIRISIHSLRMEGDKFPCRNRPE